VWDAGSLERSVALSPIMGLRIGTAGWSIPRSCAAEFPPDGSSLSRYSAQFNAAEINSSFHRPHRQSTWERWRDSVPTSFRFSVKLPKSITHHRQLVDCDALMDDFLAQTDVLGDKLAVLLVQLPPKLAFDQEIAARFFSALRRRTNVKIACEPRNATWFGGSAGKLFEQFDVARVAADPPICEAGMAPGGCLALSYWRLHGSPIVYRSSYMDRLGAYAAQLEDEARKQRDVWCIFDNTASSAAAGDALALVRMIREQTGTAS
jgi:uncharacterized protein YecE (DUF72 family)